MSGEFDIQTNKINQFCDGQGNCPLEKARQQIVKGNLSMDEIKQICRSRGLRDTTRDFTNDYSIAAASKLYVPACSKRLPRNVNYTNCGSMFIQTKDAAGETSDRYTPNPVRGENPITASSRLVTWLWFQLPPDRFQQLFKLPTMLTVVGGNDTWEKAIIKLKDEEKELLAGLTLNHPGMSWEDLYWNQLMFSPRIAEDDHSLDMGVTNSSPDNKFLTVTLQNIYQDEETETVFDVMSRANTSKVGRFELPPLVEDIPSVLMRIQEISEQQWKENTNRS